MDLIPAKVPILKLYDNYGRIEVDISCNNPLSINNTHLLFCYSQVVNDK
jgi:DNA polymerase sigma